MTRKGISFTLTLLVVGLVLLATAMALIVLGTDVTQRIGDIVGQGSSDQSDLAKNHCDRQRDTICADADLEQWEEDEILDRWADQATYEDRTCRQWQIDELIYGTTGVPPCDPPN